MFTSALNPEQRAAALSALATEEFDILVIGAGVNGVGVALDLKQSEYWWDKSNKFSKN